MRQEGLRDWLPVDVTSCPCLLFITVHLEECVFLLSPPAAPLSKLGLECTPCSSPKLYAYNLSGLKAGFGMWSLRGYWSKGRRSQDQKLCQQPRQGVARAGYPRTTLCLVALTIFFFSLTWFLFILIFVIKKKIPCFRCDEHVVYTWSGKSWEAQVVMAIVPAHLKDCLIEVGQS